MISWSSFAAVAFELVRVRVRVVTCFAYVLKLGILELYIMRHISTGIGGCHIERVGNHRVCANHAGNQIVPLVCGDQSGMIGSVPQELGGRNSGAVTAISSHDDRIDQGGAVCDSPQQYHLLSSNHHLPPRVREDVNEVTRGAREESEPLEQRIAPAGGPRWEGTEGIAVQYGGGVGRENAGIEGLGALVEQHPKQAEKSPSIREM